MRDEQNASRGAGMGVFQAEGNRGQRLGEREWGLLGSIQRVQRGQGREVKEESWKRKLKRSVGAGLGGRVGHAAEPTPCPGHPQEPCEDQRGVPMDRPISTESSLSCEVGHVNPILYNIEIETPRDQVG